MDVKIWLKVLHKEDLNGITADLASVNFKKKGPIQAQEVQQLNKRFIFKFWLWFIAMVMIKD